MLANRSRLRLGVFGGDPIELVEDRLDAVLRE